MATRNVNIEWDAATGADGYEVDVFQGSTLVDSIGGLSETELTTCYEAEVGHEYTFRVFSMADAGMTRSATFSVVTIIVSAAVGLQPPTNVRASLE